MSAPADAVEWTREKAINVSCPDCAFGFDAFHTDEGTGLYSCPLCAEARLIDENRQLRAARDRLTDALRHMLDLAVGPAGGVTKTAKLAAIATARAALAATKGGSQP